MPVALFKPRNGAQEEWFLAPRSEATRQVANVSKAGRSIRARMATNRSAGLDPPANRNEGYHELSINGSKLNLMGMGARSQLY